jgi:hypothetical protein
LNAAAKPFPVSLKIPLTTRPRSGLVAAQTHVGAADVMSKPQHAFCVAAQTHISHQ